MSDFPHSFQVINLFSFVHLLNEKSEKRKRSVVKMHLRKLLLSMYVFNFMFPTFDPRQDCEHFVRSRDSRRSNLYNRNPFNFSQK